MKYKDVNKNGDVVPAGIEFADRDQFTLALQAVRAAGLNRIADNMQGRLSIGRHRESDDAMDELARRYHEEPARQIRRAISEVANAPDDSSIAQRVGAMTLTAIRELNTSAPTTNEMSEDTIPPRTGTVEEIAARGVRQFEELLAENAAAQHNSHL